MSSSIILTIISIIFIINLIASVITVFYEKRDIASIWAWLLVLLLFPVVGFFIYAFLGRKISHNKIFDIRTQEAMGIDQIAGHQRTLLQNLPEAERNQYEEQEAFLNLFLNNDEAAVTQKNTVRIFNNGPEKFDAMFEDIRNAKDHINIEYFSIFDDDLGNQLIDLLTQKAKEGVKVRVMFDQFGSHGLNKKMYKRLIDAGGDALSFLQTPWPITFRANFRLHRKLAVIDGQIGYIGGLNVGDEYVGKSKKFGNWRDTHTRIEGDAVLAIQARFFMDWNSTAKSDRKLEFSDNYFPETKSEGDVAIQVVTSGPDQDIQQIKQGYMRQIASARKSITIQTPYFIPDQGVMDMLTIAAMSGVKVRLMIPCMPDHPFVYRATEYYAQEMLDAGGEVYTYDKGFLHAKVVVIDGKVSSVGSANMDMRSFGLNFEGNAFMYNEEIAAQLDAFFEEDIKDSTLVDKAYFEQQSGWLKFKQKFSRLLSPIL